MPSSGAAALALTLVLLAGGPASAHRLDEYLQAARLSIDPNRVQIELDLTPGTSVAESVLSEIDLDGDRSISAGETQAYSERLLNAITLEADGAPLRLTAGATDFPTVDALLKGEGTMRIQAVAQTPGLTAGLHHLRYRNGHRSDIGAYLANALAPASDRVSVEAQHRDPEQRDLVVDYTIRADAVTRINQGLWVGIAGTLLWLTRLSWRRRLAAATTKIQCRDVVT